MKYGILVCGLLLSACFSFPAAAAERDCVIDHGGCTMFVVEGNLLVTAKHCEHPQQITVNIQGHRVTATKSYVTPSEDGPVVFTLDGGPFESLPVSVDPLTADEAVYSLGYPGGNWARINGKLIDSNHQIQVNYTNHRVATGNSGGPLLNAKGEVVGIALHVSPDIGVHRSGFAGWKVTHDAVVQAKGGAIRKRGPPKERPVIIMFTQPGCAPCEALKRDVRAGHFNDYEFRYVTYLNGKWVESSNGHDGWVESNEYREYFNKVKPRNRMTFPTIWVKGTKHHRTGYSTQRRGGLLGWLRGAVRMIIGGVFGTRPEPPDMPEPGPSQPQPQPSAPQLGEAEPIKPIPQEESLPVDIPPPGPSLQERFDELLADVNTLKTQGLETRANVQEFQAAGVIGKIKLIDDLKANGADIKNTVEGLQGKVTAIRTDFKEDPKGFLWGLFAMIPGLIKRRYLDEGIA